MTQETTSSSHTITVLPSERKFTATQDETILSAAIAQGIGLPYGCKDGACGSCKCKLVSGLVTQKPYQEQALSQEDARAGWILTCGATAQTDVVLENKQLASQNALPIKKLPVRVARIEKPCEDVIILTLQLPAQGYLLYHAGQYVEFLLPGGVTRSYSMASAPRSGEKSIQFHVRHMAGGKFTDHVFTAMHEKDVLRMQGPFGGAYLQESSEKPIIFVASGTGFAPVKAMLERLIDIKSERYISVYWGGRQRKDLYLHEWMQTLNQQLPQLRYTPVLSEDTEESGWEGRHGLVHEAVLADFADLSHTQIYACGVPMMVRAAQHDFCQQRNLPQEEFFSDPFISEADKHDSTVG